MLISLIKSTISPIIRRIAICVIFQRLNLEISKVSRLFDENKRFLINLFSFNFITSYKLRITSITS